MASKDYKDIIRQMERDMQQISDEVFRGFFDLPGGSHFWRPAADVYENDVQLLVKMELAGVKPEDIQVVLSADDLVLTIKGYRKEAHVQRNGRLRCHQLEVYFGPFERALALPRGVPIERNEIAATYKDGFLLVSLPKAAAPKKRETRIIPINGQEKSEVEQQEVSEVKD